MPIKLNPFTGNFDLVNNSPDNFSYSQVISGSELSIPTNQQMILVGSFEVDGSLILEGEIVLDEFGNELEFPGDNFSYHRVVSGSILTIPQNQQMFLIEEGSFELEGELVVEGEFVADEFDQPQELPKDNFSYSRIDIGNTVEIPSGQQMIVDGGIDLEGGLDVEGELSIISDETSDGLPPYYIVSGQIYRVPVRKQMFLVGTFLLDGQIDLEGHLALGA